MLLANMLCKTLCFGNAHDCHASQVCEHSSALRARPASKHIRPCRATMIILICFMTSPSEHPMPKRIAFASDGYAHGCYATSSTYTPALQCAKSDRFHAQPF